VELTDADIDRLKAIALGDYLAPPKAPFDLHTADLFGGITGFPLPMQQFELLPGLTLTRTYAHLIAPFILAFAPPPKPSAGHPGPWVSLHGKGLTILVEIKLDAGASPLGFDRLNTLWFAMAVLRLRLALPLQMLALSDRPLREVPDDVEAANLLPVEVNLSHLLTAPPRIPTEADLEWVRENIVVASELMKEPAFNRALLTLDEAVAIQNPGAGIVIAWAAIETLIRPGAQRITDRVSRALAAYLQPPGPTRDRAFGEIVESYGARGGAVHAGAPPEAEQFHAAFRLARSAVMRAVESGELPDVEVLLEKWRTKT
jgi:hypothetical protein